MSSYKRNKLRKSDPVVLNAFVRCSTLGTPDRISENYITIRSEFLSGTLTHKKLLIEKTDVDGAEVILKVPLEAKYLVAKLKAYDIKVIAKSINASRVTIE